MSEPLDIDAQYDRANAEASRWALEAGRLKGENIKLTAERDALRAQLDEARELLTELRCEYVEGRISRAYLEDVDAWLASKGLDNPAPSKEES